MSGPGYRNGYRISATTMSVERSILRALQDCAQGIAALAVALPADEWTRVHVGHLAENANVIATALLDEKMGDEYRKALREVFGS